MLPVERAPGASLGPADGVTERPRGLPHAADRPGFEKVHGMSDATDPAKGPRCEESPKHAHGWRIPLGCHDHLVGSATLAPNARRGGQGQTPTRDEAIPSVR